MTKENLKMNGRFYIEHRDKNGNVVLAQEFPNVITNKGKNNAAALMLTDITGYKFDWIAIGTVATTAAATQTALAGELTTGGGARKTATGTLVTTTVTNDTAQLEVTFSFTASHTIRETGIFTALSSGTMGARQTMSAVSVSSGDSLTVRWKVAFA